MARTNLWSKSVPRIELDQRSREARLRFERTDQLFIVRATVRYSRLGRLVYWFTVGRSGRLPRESGVKKPARDRWPFGLTMLLGLSLKMLNAAANPVFSTL